MGNINEYVNGKVSENREQIEYHVEKILELIGEDTGREDCLKHQHVLRGCTRRYSAVIR